MNKVPWVIILPVLLCGPLNVYPQSDALIVERLTTAHGLSHSGITSIVQDSTGFLWIGTEHGLNRYDGHQFKTFGTGRGDSSGLANGDVKSLCVDPSGILWVGTARGLYRYDPIREGFVAAAGALRRASINVVAVDSSGTLWIGAVTGLARYTPDTREVALITQGNSPDSLRANNVLAVHVDHRDNVWIGTHRGLQRLGHGRTRFEDADLTRGESSSDEPAIISLYRDRLSFLWVGTILGVNVIDLSGPSPTARSFLSPPLLRHSMITGITEDKWGVIWLATAGGGLHSLSRAEAQTLRNGSALKSPPMHYRHSPLNTSSIPHDKVRSVFEDKSGGLWIGTVDGVGHSDNDGGRFRRYVYDPASPKGLPSSLVTSVCQDAKGTIWIGTADGIARADSTLGLVESVEADSMIDIAAFHQDRRDMLWVGTWHGLWRFDPRTRTSRRYHNDPANQNSLSSDVVISIAEQPEGILWFGTYGGGLNRYDVATGRFTRFMHSEQDSMSLTDNTVFGIHAGKENRLWIGTRNGLNLYNTHDNRFMRSASGAQAWGTSGLAVGPIKEENDTVWAGTASGLHKLVLLPGTAPSLLSSEVYRTGEGLPGEMVTSLSFDNEGSLWMGTNNGIARLDRSLGQIRSFGPADGCQAVFCSNNASVLTRGGEVIVGAQNGLYRFDPRALRQNRFIPPVVITGFRKFNRDVTLDSSITSLRSIVLNHDEKVISFQFAGLSFVRPARNQYAYLMEGFDKSWTYCGTTHDVTYTNLDPGEYLFRLRAANNDGVWNETGAALSITILPPFWKTWWFQLLVFAAIAVLVYAVYRYRLNRVLELERLRLRIASDLHDDIGSNLSSIALSSQMILRDPSVSGSLRERLGRIAGTARHTADSMRDVVWMINPGNDDLDDMVLRMKDVASQLLQNITYTFSAPTGVLSQSIELEAKRNVYLVYKEILNNIVKHAHASSVSIEIRKSDDQIAIAITDNGKGFQPEDSQRGNGLRNLKSRMGAIGGTLEVTSAPGKGTTVRASFDSRKSVMEKR